jgi:UDP-2-acetamido-3-amino-2,3-dideoxy-glucuronate N-acetyltransferase
MSEFGHRLEFNTDGIATCPESSQEYKLDNGHVVRTK